MKIFGFDADTIAEDVKQAMIYDSRKGENQSIIIVISWRESFARTYNAIIIGEEAVQNTIRPRTLTVRWTRCRVKEIRRVEGVQRCFRYWGYGYERQEVGRER